MVFGKYPFYGEDIQSITTVYKSNKAVEFPVDRPIQFSLQQLLSKLLSLNKEDRISLEDAMFSEWYDDVE